MPCKKPFDFNKAFEEHKKGGELVNIVLRGGGGKGEYKKMYRWISWGEKPR
jgi:hypothetical protein